MAAFEVIALDTATPQLRAPGASDTYTFPRAVEMPLGTANGVLYLNGSKVVTSGSALTLDSSGNLGLGVTPSAWNLGKAIEIYSVGNAVWGATTTQINVLQNAYWNSGYKYASSNPATYYQQSSGVHAWHVAPSGTAGNPISFTQAMTLDASGRFLVGTTTAGVGGSANTIFTAKGNSDTYASIIAAGNEELLLAAQSGITKVGAFSNHPLLFITNNQERARITSGGYFKASDAGTYQNAAAAYHEIRQSASDWIVYIVNSNATPYGINLGHITDANSTGSPFLACNAGAALGTLRAEIRSNGGLANYQSNNVDLSDIRTKTDINPVASYWSKIAALEIVSYKYKDQTHDDLNIGVIAQQVEQVAPEFVDTDGFGDTPEDGVPLKTIYNKDLTFAAIKALQEAMARIEVLEAKVAALEA